MVSGTEDHPQDHRGVSSQRTTITTQLEKITIDSFMKYLLVIFISLFDIHSTNEYPHFYTNFR